MGFFEKRNRGPRISREEALRCRPVKNVRVKETRMENGTVMLSFPVQASPWVISLIKRFSDARDRPVIKKLELDILGSAVWDLLDGKRTVKKVIREFAGKFQLHPKEAEVSVTQFIQQLGKRGLIGLREDRDPVA